LAIKRLIEFVNSLLGSDLSIFIAIFAIFGKQTQEAANARLRGGHKRLRTLTSAGRYRERPDSRPVERIHPSHRCAGFDFGRSAQFGEDGRQFEDEAAVLAD
jgi:hypothetical protein